MRVGVFDTVIFEGTNSKEEEPKDKAVNEGKGELTEKVG